MTNDLIAAATNYPIMKFFVFDHLPSKLQEVSHDFAAVALSMAKAPRNAETSAGLRKLLEARECAARAALLSDNR